MTEMNTNAQNDNNTNKEQTVPESEIPIQNSGDTNATIETKSAEEGDGGSNIKTKILESIQKLHEKYNDSGNALLEEYHKDLNHIIYPLLTKEYIELSSNATITYTDLTKEDLTKEDLTKEDINKKIPLLKLQLKALYTFIANEILQAVNGIEEYCSNSEKQLPYLINDIMCSELNESSVNEANEVDHNPNNTTEQLHNEQLHNEQPIDPTTTV